MSIKIDDKILRARTFRNNFIYLNLYTQKEVQHMSISIKNTDIASATNITKLVSGRNIGELNQNDITFCLKFYYDCISLMKQCKINCFVVD